MSLCWMSLCWVSIILGVIYADCHMQELYAECHYAECQLYWVLYILSVSYTGCNLCWLSPSNRFFMFLFTCKNLMLSRLYWMSFSWVSVLLSVILADCHIYTLYAKCHYAERQLYWVLSWLIVKSKPFMLIVNTLNVIMLGVINADCHMLMLSVSYTGCNLCWLSHARTLCWVSLYWMSLCWVSCRLNMISPSFLTKIDERD